MSVKKKILIYIKIAVFILVIIFFAGKFSDICSVSDSESRKILARSIDRAVTDCYAIEGMYPPDFKYLEDNYGIHIDEKKYYVDYQAFGSNIRPVIVIANRGSLSVSEGDISEQ